MRRAITPTPSRLPKTEKYVVSVEGSNRDSIQIVLTEKSVFGTTALTFCPATAREVAAYLLRAADAAEQEEAAEQFESADTVPKMAAVR